MHLLCQICSPKQKDLQAFLQLFVSMLLLSSGCKSAAAQYKCYYYLVPPQSILTKQIEIKLRLCNLYLSLMAELRPFKTYTEVQNRVSHPKKCAWYMHNETAYTRSFKSQYR